MNTSFYSVKIETSVYWTFITVQENHLQKMKNYVYSSKTLYPSVMERFSSKLVKSLQIETKAIVWKDSMVGGASTFANVNWLQDWDFSIGKQCKPAPAVSCAVDVFQLVKDWAKLPLVSHFIWWTQAIMSGTCCNAIQLLFNLCSFCFRLNILKGSSCIEKCWFDGLILQKNSLVLLKRPNIAKTLLFL